MSYLLILRPANLIFVGICVLFGAWNPGYEIRQSIWQVLAGVLSAILIAGAGYAVNDYFDLEIDKINKPQRTLPSGKMKREIALFYSIGLFFLGVLCSYFTASIFCLLLSFFNVIILFLYARYFKKEFLSGNLIVAYAAASTFIYGGGITGNLSNGLIIALFAFFYTFLRELVKDLEDRRADEMQGAKTLAVCWNKGQVMNLYLMTVIVMILLSGFFYISVKLEKPVLVLLFFFVIIPLLLFYRIMSSSKGEKIFGRISGLMKLDMFLLLMIFAIGNRL